MNEKKGNFQKIIVGNDISYLFRKTHHQKYNNPIFQESIKIGRESRDITLQDQMIFMMITSVLK